MEDKDRQIRIPTDENERLKRRLNNDSTNSSMPPSSDRPGKPANHYNGREKSGKKAGAQKGHKGTALTRKDVEEKIRSGKFLHKVETLGTPCGAYRTKYILDRSSGRSVSTGIMKKKARRSCTGRRCPMVPI